MVKDFAQTVVVHLARTIPSRFVAKSGAQKRKGKFFVDYLRKGHSQTTAAAFSAWARPGLGVLMAISWEDVSSIESGSQWSIQTAREYLSFRKEDPWAAYWSSKQGLAKSRRILDV